MAWWQKKLLRYALSRTGLLDDKALDPDKLDITLGKKNVVELTDVGLNIKRINKIVQLPPNLRVETARVLSLRLTVPADIYQSSIVAEVDGVELSLRLEEEDEVRPQEPQVRARQPVTTRTPQHRKVHRRLYSPPPYDPGGLEDSNEAYIPTTEELAKSFLLEEPVQERRELEASVAANSKSLDESIASESSEGDGYGTGGGIGLPGFLAGFLQGIIDRLQVKIKNVEAKLETEAPGLDQSAVPVTVLLHIGTAELASVVSGDSSDQSEQPNHQQGSRRVKIQNVSLNLVSDEATFSELSELPSPSSPAESRRDQSLIDTKTSSSRQDASGQARPPTSPTQQSFGSDGSDQRLHAQLRSPDVMRASNLTDDADRFADAGQDNVAAEHTEHNDLDIQPGDDNISWGSRRVKSNAPVEDLWNSMVCGDDLPGSLLLERASTPRAHSSRGASPTATRTQRDASPYARSLRSPGSWPRLDESPPRRRSGQTPGSWPALDHSQQPMFQPFPQEPSLPTETSTDNKRTAIEASIIDQQGFDTPSEPEAGETGDLAQSRVFSHEEAESMYMSAMTHSPSIHIPGGWDTESDGPTSPEDTWSSDRQRSESELSNVDVPENEDLADDERPHRSPTGNITPRATSPEMPIYAQSDVKSTKPQASRRLLHVDVVSVWLPNAQDAAEEDVIERSAPPSASVSYAPRGMPGTFSAYSEMAASRRGPGSSRRDAGTGTASVLQETSHKDAVSNLSIEIGVVKGQVDIPSCRLLHRLVTKNIAIFNLSRSSETEQRQAKASKGGKNTALSVSVQNVYVALRESAKKSDLSSFSPSDNLVTLSCRSINFSSEAEEVDLRIGSFQTYLGSSQFLSFDRGRDMKTSIIISEESPDIAIVAVTKRTTVKRPVTDITLETMPLNIMLDLGAIDDTFECFGGLSGVLEAGNSILSESGVMSSTASPTKLAKGVRFEDDSQYIGTELELKINGRIGGLVATLQGTACSIRLWTTTLKAVYREHGAVSTIEQVFVSGPRLSNSPEAPLSIDFSTVRLEYLLSPQDKYLERLLSLLTPSKDKYDDNDDILIDTLLRQRRKGAVARVSVSEIKLNCLDRECISTLSALTSELSKLSAVTKYLPEDERPGLLTLIRIKQFEACLPVNDLFGNVHTAIADFHCAHVGLPALLALSIGDLKGSKNGKTELVHPLVSLSGPENLPLIMARMLGDEVEPTVKIKLFNICIEYSVSVVLALTGLDNEAETEEVVAELAQSVAQLALRQVETVKERASPVSDAGPKTKKMNIDLLVHDSAIGLTPQRLASKGLFVLTEARFSTAIPVQKSLNANLELRKAGLLITDQLLVENSDATVRSRKSSGNTTAKPKLTLALSKQGFVSVGSIMAARISARIANNNDSNDQTVDVDVSNDLLLLETCADSTQTMIATLTGLTPPPKPSKQPKYLTEPMTIEDMMASFTGDAFTKPEVTPETLFDVEEEHSDDMESMLDIPTLAEDDNDGLFADSEMTSSLYGPVSGMLGGVDRPDDDDPVTEDFGETAESLLEDDPFEMPSSPTDANLSDNALIKELNKQCKPVRSGGPVDLGLYEIEDLGFDALGGNQTALGTQHRFNTPGTSRRAKTLRKDQALPFRLKLRDCHVIWNIHDGYDWQRTRDGITEVVEQVENKAEERKARHRQSLNQQEEDESVIGDFLFNSIYIGVPSSHDAQELRRQINRNIDEFASETESVPMSGMSKPTTYSASGRPVGQRTRRRLKLERSEAHKIAFELKGVSADVLVFPPDSKDVVLSVDVRVKDLEIYDNVPSSTWRKFLTHQYGEHDENEMSKPMLHIELLNLRTLENFAASELAMHVSVLPLRLHVDQDALDFITRFFEFKDESSSASGSDSEQPFLQRVEIDTVDLCLDYKPKKVDYGGIRSGHTTEFMNFIILDAANIRLKHAIIYGIKGFEPLHKTLNDVWMPDVKRNQLPTVLSGLAPVRSLANIGAGVRDVVAIPVREYRKDGRIVRSIQKGAYHFGKTTASELARLGAKVAIGTQTLLQGAEGLLSPTAASPGGRSSPGRRKSSDQGWHDVGSDDEEHGQRAISAYSNQPLGVLSGLRSARRFLEHDLLTARDALIAVQGEVLESSNPGSAAAAVAKHAPTVILRPIIGTSRAVGTALLGVGNQIDRGNIRRMEDVSRPLPAITTSEQY